MHRRGTLLLPRDEPQGLRATLNFGHTIGHAIEARTTGGSAVAAGAAVVAVAARTEQNTI